MSVEGSTTRTAKHMTIMGQIDRTSKLVNDLDRLLNEIRGGNDTKWEPMDDAKASPRPIASLAEFLVNEGDRINTINSHFEDLITSIRNELF